MDPNSKHTKRNVLIFGIGYVLATLFFGIFVVIGAVGCINDGGTTEQDTFECLEEQDQRNGVFQLLFALVQIGGIGLVVYLLIQHQNKRREMYGHNTQHNAAMDHQMQQQQTQQDQSAAQQPPVQGSDEHQDKQ